MIVLDKSEELENWAECADSTYDDAALAKALREAAAKLKAQRERIKALEGTALSKMLAEQRQRAEKAEADRDHWEQQAAKNHAATLEAM